MPEFTYNNKYKMRDPKETVSIITDFFSSKGYEVREALAICVPWSGTWWHTIELYKQDVFIATANGKGVTKEFSKASGYSELYERFCSKIVWHRSSLLLEEFNKQSLNKLGYIEDKHEKLIDLSDFDSNKYEILNSFHLNTNPRWQDLTVGIGKLEECCYKKINSDDYIYLNQKILLDCSGSNGLAAGNTLEEAYVQAVSEVFERGVFAKLLNHELISNEAFYTISNDNKEISDENKKIINTLKNNNITTTIFDFSYNYNVPAVGIIVSKNGVWRFTLGAQPDFNIALERCLTETFQGISLIDDLFNNYVPERYTKENTRPVYSKGIDDFIPECLLLNKQQVNTINADFWHTSKSINDQVNFCNKCAEDNDLNIYYYNNSLCKNMYAISIYCPELANSLLLISEKFNIINTNPSIKNQNIRIPQNIRQDEYIRMNEANDKMNTFLRRLIANEENLVYTRYPMFSIEENLSIVNVNLSFLKLSWFSHLWSDLSFSTQTELAEILNNLNSHDIKVIDKDYLFLYKYYLTQKYTDKQIEQLAKCHNTKFEKLNIYDRNKMVYNLLFSRVKEIIRLYIEEIIPDYIEYKQEYNAI